MPNGTHYGGHTATRLYGISIIGIGYITPLTGDAGAS